MSHLGSSLMATASTSMLECQSQSCSFVDEMTVLKVVHGVDTVLQFDNMHIVDVCSATCGLNRPDASADRTSYKAMFFLHFILFYSVRQFFLVYFWF